MQVCEGCNSLAIDLFHMHNGQRLCDYCSQALINVEKKKPAHKPRVYSNTVHFIREKFGSVTAWGKKRGYTVNEINYAFARKVSCDEMLSDSQKNIFYAMKADGMGKFLAADGFVSRHF